VRFVYDVDQSDAAGDDVQNLVAEVVAVLRQKDVDLRTRPQPHVWSPLEYGCHVRDMLLVQRERVLTARRMNRVEPCDPTQTRLAA
jgi:hypothetical protein